MEHLWTWVMDVLAWFYWWDWKLVRRRRLSQQRTEKEKLARDSFRVRRYKHNNHNIGRRNKLRTRRDKHKSGTKEPSDSRNAAPNDAAFARLGRVWNALPITRWTRSNACVEDASHYVDPINSSSSSRSSERDDDVGSDGVEIVAIDCEMVGAGYKGRESILARCSIVKLKRPFDSSSANHRSLRTEVIYDKLVRPTKHVVDYRTEFSGITREMLNTDDKGISKTSSLPVVSFEQCRNAVTSILASIDGKPVLVVGHDVQHDFDALHLSHPFELVRDTAYYKPFMQKVRNRRYRRKLAALAKEELGTEIQTDSVQGHSSVEDATTAMSLYLKHQRTWERSLAHPLRLLRTNRESNGSTTTTRRSRWRPLVLYLDGCNLPFGLRTQYRGASGEENERDDGGAATYQLISKTVTRGTHETDTPFDWIPAFVAVLRKDPAQFRRIDVLFDGAMCRGRKENKRPPPSSSTEIAPNVRVHVTAEDVQVDDVLVQRTGVVGANDDDDDDARRRPSSPPLARTVLRVEDVVRLFDDEGTEPPPSSRNGADGDCDTDRRHEHYVVVRRIAGGSKTNKKLFSKLNLRRAEEGALFLTSLTRRLRKHSSSIARELERAGVRGLVEFELRSRSPVRSIVATDDVLLADRLAAQDEQSVVVLNYKQLQQLV